LLTRSWAGLVREGRRDRRDYQAWLADHAKTMYEKHGIDPDGIGDVAASIRDQLAAAQTVGFDEEMCPSFEELVEEAAGLDADLKMCRAWFQIFMYDEEETLLGVKGNWARHGMNIQTEDFMEEVEETGSRQVALVVSPTLIKRGNSSGEDYDRHQVIENRQVLCGGI
jgi:hypothetical protein